MLRSAARARAPPRASPSRGSQGDWHQVAAVVGGLGLRSGVPCPWSDPCIQRQPGGSQPFIPHPFHH